MRILTLTSQYPPHYYGGYELSCQDVMERFRHAGHRVDVLTSTARVPGVADVAEPHVHRELTPQWDWERNRARRPAGPLGRLALERAALETLRRWLARVQPDVVSVWHMIGIPLSLLAGVAASGVPAVVTVENDWLIQAPEFDSWQRLWRRWPSPGPRAVAGVPVALPPLGAAVNFASAFTRRRAVEQSPFPVDPAAPVVRLGVDLTDFPLADPPDRPWGWRVLYVGRLDVTKGVATLVRAFAGLPATARLELVGRGSPAYQAELAALARQLGVAARVRFDSCPRAALRERYRAADVVVFPSEWDEPFGIVPLEAMACGVPVVATGTGGSAEFLRDGDNALLFARGEAAALRAALTRLAGDPPLRARLLAGGRRTAAELTADRHAGELLELHARAAAGGGAALAASVPPGPAGSKQQPPPAQ